MTLLSTPSKHLHTAADVAPGTVTLCATTPTDDGGLRWAHLPVDAALWHYYSRGMRGGLRERIRREVGDDQAPIHAVDLDEAGQVVETDVSDFRAVFLAGLVDAPAVETAEELTERGMEITFQPTDPRGCGGGTLIVPPALLPAD